MPIKFLRPVFFGLVTVAVLAAAGCTSPTLSPSPTRSPVQTAPGGATTVVAGNCAECHDDSTVVMGTRLQWQKSLHGSGESYERSVTASCAGCHSHERFVSLVVPGGNFTQSREGVMNPSPPNCRTCHQVHKTYTASDWALQVEKPVTFVVGGTFDGGAGNLCVNCHQPRRTGPAVGDGTVNVDSERWGPHHGVQGTSFVGTGGYGVDGTPSIHYAPVGNTCVACHMENNGHEMEPTVTSCQGCHSGLTDFDYNGVQTDVRAKIAELKRMLETRGLLRNDLAVPGDYTEAQAGAIWNYLAVTEDGSFGVHNPVYLEALLDKGIEGLR